MDHPGLILKWLDAQPLLGRHESLLEVSYQLRDLFKEGKRVLEGRVEGVLVFLLQPVHIKGLTGHWAGLWLDIH